MSTFTICDCKSTITYFPSPCTPIPPAPLMRQVTWPKCFCQAHPLQGDPVQSDPVNIGEQNRNWVPYFPLSHFSFLEGKRIKGQHDTLLIDAHLVVLIDSLIKLRPFYPEAVRTRWSVTVWFCSSCQPRSNRQPAFWQQSEPVSHSLQTQFPPHKFVYLNVKFISCQWALSVLNQDICFFRLNISENGLATINSTWFSLCHWWEIERRLLSVHACAPHA